MICPSCNVDRPEKDFLGKERCYKCIYKEKTSDPKCKVSRCKICDGILPTCKRKFCSQACINESMKIHNRDYWTRNVKIYNIEWN